MPYHTSEFVLFFFAVCLSHFCRLKFFYTRKKNNNNIKKYNVRQLSVVYNGKGRLVWRLLTNEAPPTKNYQRATRWRSSVTLGITIVEVRVFDLSIFFVCDLLSVEIVWACENFSEAEFVDIEHWIQKCAPRND